MDILTSEAFLEHLRDALHHLRDPDRLRQNPLATLFGVANRFDTPAALQRILVEAIGSLEPETDVPSHSRDWRIYDALFYRYVQQFSPQEVADQLGIGARHLRREQRAALEVLAYQLWRQFDLEAKLGEGTHVEAAPAQGAQDIPTVNAELAWLQNVPLENPTDLDQALPDALDLARPLAARHQVRLTITTTDALPKLAAHPVALGQILLNLIGVAIYRASGGQVHISARPLRWEVEIQVRGTKSMPTFQPASDDDAASLDMACQLTELCGGRLALSGDASALNAVLTFPALEQLPVLAVDDNADTLQLLQRYTSGTRYRLIGTRDPERALGLAEKLSPQIIILDVMMPQVDGWKVLGRLRQHPSTEHIPIIVCTILAQEELALSLGASTFLRKPVKRPAFLAALDRVAPLMTGSR